MRLDFLFSWVRNHPRWVLTVAAAVFLLPGLPTFPLLDRDEPRFAHCTVEMMKRADWIVPWFNDEYRFDKPPLTYWWMALHFQLFGRHELAARLHSAVAAWLLALLIFQMGRRTNDTTPGLLAGMAWLTSFQVLVHARLCVADMPMILFATLAQWSLWQLLRLPVARPWNRWFWIFWLAQAAAFLAKGPLPLGVSLLTLLLYRFVFWRQPIPWANLQPRVGLLLFFVIVGSWGVPALIATSGEFFAVGIGEHVIKRTAEPFNHRPFIPGYYFLTVFLSLLPWAALLRQGWDRLRANWQPWPLFLLSWGTAVFAIFSVVATQLPHYVLPAFPALLLLLLSVAPRYSEMTSGARVFFQTVLGVTTVVFWLVGLVVAVGGFREGWTPIHLALLGLVLVPLALNGGLWCFVTGKKRLAGLCFALVPLGFFQMGKQLQGLLLAEQVAHCMDEMAVDRQVRPIGWNYHEPSLVWYTDRFWDFTGDPAAVVKARYGHSPKAVLLVLEEETRLEDWARHWWQGGELRPGRILAESDGFRELPGRALTIEGLNLGRFTWVRVTLYWK